VLRPQQDFRLCAGGVHLHAHSRGRADRLALYEARKLNYLPDSLLDYNDVIGSRETSAQRRAREGPGHRPPRSVTCGASGRARTVWMSLPGWGTRFGLGIRTVHTPGAGRGTAQYDNFTNEEVLTEFPKTRRVWRRCGTYTLSDPCQVGTSDG